MTDHVTDRPFVFIATDFCADDWWKPKLVDVDWLARYLRGAHYAGETPHFRLYWFTADGSAVECRVEPYRRPAKYDENDYATARWYVMTPRGACLAEISYSIDGRA
jgi:hypothetical protein